MDRDSGLEDGAEPAAERIRENSRDIFFVFFLGIFSPIIFEASIEKRGGRERERERGEREEREREREGGRERERGRWRKKREREKALLAR